MAAEDMPVDPDEVIVTTGGQQAIDLVTKTLIDPGDVVIAEAPTYPGAVPTFCSYEADVIQIEMDSDGMLISALEETLARLDAQGRRPKFIYTIPNFQNPAGVTMSLERRRRLVEIARERELLVLEDNPYGMLRFEGEALPTLRTIEGPTGSAGRERLRRSTPGRCRRSSRPASASAGSSRRGRCSPSSSSASSRPTCAPRRSRSISSPPTSPPPTGVPTSRRCASSTAAAAT